MTRSDRWLLPEGIEEILPPESWRLEALHRSLFNLYCSWGYELVIPPMIEFLESLLTGAGNDLDLQTFKITDQSTGRLMGIRADMTPQAARIDAHQLKRDVPTRLFYMGTVLHTRDDGFGGTRSPLQVGAELFGHAGIESDVEILELMLETLAVAGVTDIHLDLGHVGIFRALANRAGLDNDAEAQLFEALQRKALPEISELLGDLPIADRQKEQILALPELNGSEEVLPQAREVLGDAGEEVLAALRNLESIAVQVKRRRPGLPLYFDLAELRGYRFHTGAVFAAFVPGMGQEIARGGRYDQIGKVFGRARPATGFSVDLKNLMRLNNGEGATTPAGIFAPAESDATLEAEVRRLRDQGERVIMALPEQSGDAAAMACDRVLVKKGEAWQVVAAGKK